MRISTTFLNPLIANHRTSLTLKKIYTLHAKYSNQLFIQPLNTYLLTELSKPLFSRKTTKPSLKTLQNPQLGLTRHRFFLTHNPYAFTQNQSFAQVFTPTRTKSIQYRSLPRVTNRQTKRIRTLFKYLLVIGKKTNPYALTGNFSTNLNTLQRYKLLQNPTYAQLPLKSFPRSLDSHKIFNFFLTLLKLYKRNSRKHKLLPILKNTKNVQSAGSGRINTFLVANDNFPTHLTFSTSTTPIRIKFRKKVAPIKTLKKLNLRYYWVIDRLNPTRSFQPSPSFLVLTKLERRPPLTFNPTQNTNLFRKQQQLYTTNVNLKSLIVSNAITDKNGPLLPISSTHRFATGTEVTSLTTLTLASTTQVSKLNTQERTNARVQQFSFVTTLATKKFLSILVSQTKFLTPKNIWESLFSQQQIKKINSTYTTGRPGKLTSWSKYQNDDLYINTRLTHIRFKPGYARQWRTFRNEFRETFSLPNRYQYRLTRHLAGLHTSQRLHQNKMQTLLLKHSLVESKLASNLEVAVQYITKGLTFLNGSLSSNPNLHLVQHDFVQLVVSLKYYTIIKWQTAQTLKNKSILAKLLWKRGKNWRRNKFTFPNWVLNFSTTFLDTPLYLEVDHFSLSTYVLTTNQTKINSMQHYPQVLPLYNWKYII